MDRKSIVVKKRIGYIVSAICLLASAIAGTPVHAAYTKDDTFYNGNNVLFYDPNYTNNVCSTGDDSGDSSSGGGTSGANVSDLKKSDRLQTIFQDLLNGGMNAVQAAAVMGNMYIESAHKFDPDVYENGVNIPSSGYGLVQWTNNRPDYTTGRRTNLENYAKQQGTPKSDLNLQIKFLLKEYNDSYKASLASSGFGTGTNVDSATEAWMKIYENPAQTGSDPAQINERKAAAEKIYGFYSDLTAGTPATTGDATTACASSQSDDGSGTAVQGDILQTALNYAWPKPVNNGVNQMSQARVSYQTDKPKYDDEGLPSDCGAFVSTVMRASGADPNFPKLGVHLMGPYVRAHPTMYKIIEHAQTSDMQPGDILIEYSFDHIEISKGGVQSVDASNTQRIPSVRPTGGQYMAGEGSFIARYIGGKS